MYFLAVATDYDGTDAELAQAAAEVEWNKGLDAVESRKRISEAVIQRYTAPSKASET